MKPSTCKTIISCANKGIGQYFLNTLYDGKMKWKERGWFGGGERELVIVIEGRGGRGNCCFTMLRSSNVLFIFIHLVFIYIYYACLLKRGGRTKSAGSRSLREKESLDYI